MEQSAFKSINGHPYKSYWHTCYNEDEMLQRSAAFYHWMNERRTVREFSDRPIPDGVLENLVLTASTAPSGAHKQPWMFCIVKDAELKKQIRKAAEAEEYESYHGRMSKEWLDDLAHLGTDWHKPFLETAPALIIVFRKPYEIDENGNKRQNYYVQESCGIAVGMLLAAIHNAGLVALTHTPSPMNFLHMLLQRPENEKPFLLIPVGYVAGECWVPDQERKMLSDVAVFY